MVSSQAVAADSQARRIYRRNTWPMRILVPAVAITVIAIAVRDGGSVAIVGVITAVIAGAFLYAAERGGVYATDVGIDYRPIVSGRGASWSWAEIDRFAVEQPAGVMAVFAFLKDGTRTPLLPTQGWSFQRQEVERLCDQLNAELDNARRASKPG